MERNRGIADPDYNPNLTDLNPVIVNRDDIFDVSKQRALEILRNNNLDEDQKATAFAKIINGYYEFFTYKGDRD